MTDAFQGFFSYARDDWGSPVVGKDLRDLFGGLPKEVSRNLPNCNFSLWQDTKQLRLGTNWSSHIEAEVGKADLFLVPLSVAWLGSEYCAREYDVFVKMASAKGWSNRILPFLLAEISEKDRKALTPAQLNRYRRLRELQTDILPNLPALEDGQKKVVLQGCAARVKAVIEDLRETACDNANGNSQHSDNRAANLPVVEGNVVPAVSGEYDMPSQLGCACTLRLTIAGRSEVETPHGSVIFAVTSLVIKTEVAGGEIVDENPDFATGWNGPIAHVTWASVLKDSAALSIDALGDSELRGQPLVAEGEAGHIRLFDIEAEDASAVEIAGSVSVNRRAVKVLELHRDEQLSAADLERRVSTKAKLIDILLKGHLKESSELEPYGHD